ncbi:primosomal replication protein N'' [Psychromonas sp. CNPT3]|uniref:primosomal replication protein n=1 Tax=Psychromonas sp. CNPT3 TaxID=314282 RepID=UPI00006E47FB|nr:primosomal replication protein [Psychromonas sp. CNPT3]AGH81246.1 primosomal replication protein N'' [Psychromonas sp. CNPT3]
MASINKSYQTLLSQLQQQLLQLSQRCKPLDAHLKQTENHYFAFEVHMFSKKSLTLMGYIKQIQTTLKNLNLIINKHLPDSLINIECERFIAQYQLLLQLVICIEKGEEKKLYHSYSNPKEKIYQQLKKQYDYEQRLLNMIAEQEEKLATSPAFDAPEIRYKIDALKVRYQKCNAFTQNLEFKLEAMQNE